MNSLKTLVVVALLGAVGYGVYVSITRNPRRIDDPGVAPAWPSANPRVQIPGPGPTAAPFSANTAPSAAPASGASGMSPLSGPAPLVGPATRSSATAAGGVASLAPPLVSPGTLSPSAALPSNVGPPAYPAPGYPAIGNNAATATETPLAAGTPTALSAQPLSRAGGSFALGSSAAAFSAEGDLQSKYAAFMESVRNTLDEGRLDEGLRTLSMVYDNPNLPPAQARQVTTLLDQVAGTVIYSRKHLIEPPYTVQPGERLDQIAQKYNVPWELLAHINGVRDPGDLSPGQELKVVRGPFSAVINLGRYEMTLMLQGRYAGRFPIGIGRDQPKLEGEYTVRDKIAGPIYAGRDGTRIGAGDPNNPLGKFLIDLGNQVGIHGTNDPRNIGRDDSRGAICLGPRDIDDVFGILSIGSQVVIQR